MASTHPKATFTGTIWTPAGVEGVPGKLIATPLTQDQRIVLNDGLALGPETAVVLPTGAIQSPGLKIPIVAGVLWNLHFQPDEKGRSPWSYGAVNLNVSGDLKDLLPTEVTAVDATVVADVLGAADQVAADRAAVEAVGTTNDTIIAGRINATGSATQVALSTAIAAETRVMPHNAGASPLTSVVLPRELVGIDPVADTGFTIDVTNIYQIDALSTKIATQTPQVARGLPPNVTDAASTQRIYRWKDRLYTFGVDATDGLHRVFSAPPITGAGSLAWVATGLVLVSGGKGYGTHINGDADYLYVAEYGDPVGGPSIYRSPDGTTWTRIYGPVAATRHCHGVMPDPYNPGHVWATWGDGQGLAITRSIDHGTTWTTVATDGRWQCVQITFTPEFVFLAADSDYGSAFVVDRATNTIKALTPHSHYQIAVPAPAALGDRFYSKGWFGCVDPATGAFYFVANSSTTGGNTIGIFCIPKPGVPIVLLAKPTVAASDPAHIYAGYFISGKHAFPLLQF